MLIAIDIGNTHTVLGVYEGTELRRHWRFSSLYSRTSDECGLMLGHILESAGLSRQKISGGVIASVVPPLTSMYDDSLKQYFQLRPVIVHAGLSLGITIGSDEPGRVGADRIANGVAVYEKYGGPSIVVDLGTATTFDVLSKDAEYLGGIIAPGMETSAATLFHKTAQLPKIDIGRPDAVIGRTTEQSLRSGLYYGTVGLIDEIVQRILDELGEKARIIATGGLAKLVADESRTIEKVEPFLTLDGLRFIFEKNAPAP